jgi:transposase
LDERGVHNGPYDDWHRSSKKNIAGSGVDAYGKVSLRKQLKRVQKAAFFANLPPCLVGMEACDSARYWPRKLQVLDYSGKTR